MKKVLTIAGSDSIGGAGIQADIKTMAANGVYAMSVITALTAQNTLGVHAVSEVSPEFLAQQIDAVFSDIVPDAVKIGMVSSAALINVIAERLAYYEAENIVLDPVMVATSGGRLICDGAITALTEKLFPLATVITPNIPEAEALSDMNIQTENDMLYCAEHIGKKYNCSVLLKGGHFGENATDILFSGGKITRFSAAKIDIPDTHGTGCTLSSAIASNLAKGMALESAIQCAKEYITGALLSSQDSGKGSRLINHLYKVTKGL